MERKQCNECKEYKELYHFHMDRGKPRSNCRVCHNQKKKNNYNNKRELYIEKMRLYDKSPKAKRQRSEGESKRVKSDALYKLKKTCRSRLQKAITGWCRSKKTEEIIGCSWVELKTHIENQFQEGMTWENHGYHGWHIDHIIPLASAQNLQEVEKLSHYTNLQPLWAQDNFMKSSKP